MCQSTAKKRLEYLRGELRAARLSYGEISELQDLAAAGHIDAGDVEMLEAAGVPEVSETSGLGNTRMIRWMAEHNNSGSD